jgi:hypothetical protein
VAPDDWYDRGNRASAPLFTLRAIPPKENSGKDFLSMLDKIFRSGLMHKTQ